MFKKFTSKLPVIFCFLVTCLFVVLASACSSGEKSKAESQKSTSSNKFSLYLKGNNLYMARYNNSEIIDLGPCTTNGSVMKEFSITPYSKDTDLFCSFSDYDGETYTLYTSTSKAPTKRTKVADKVTVHSILKNGDILYLSNKELFLYKGGKAVSLFKENKESEMRYTISENQDKLFIVPFNHNSEKEFIVDAYFIDIYSGKKTIYSDINPNILSYSFDLDTVCYFNDNTLYQLKDGSSKKIVAGIKQPYNYYSVASDKVIYTSKIDEPGFLYKFDYDGNEELVSDSLVEFVDFNRKEDLLAYIEKNSEGETVLKIQQNGEILGEYKDIQGSKDDKIEEVLPYNSKYWYFFSKENNKLWRVTLKGDSKGEIELMNDNISNFDDMYTDKKGKKENDSLLYTAKKLENDYYSLFIDGNIVIQNLGEYSSHANLVIDDTNSYIIYNTSLPGTSTGHTDTYHIWENGKDTIVAENVKDYNGFLPTYEKFEKTYFLTDYDENKGTGILKQYLNGKLKDIDNDVKGFVRNNTSSRGSILYKYH
ncbi:hypothetical protein EHV10_07985 [Lachnoanaerobaculum gingivalis]|uniref:DUF5050 domain-containing protein n=1 Tax=Lachnoanaerobaculum gingivalis TaxID=2490855 RepID=A0A3P3QWB4_9FIRM|nr:hypothetical protein [Lachnoanaerobaculum gingivalis]RRJ25557.1 hypothetical protein EHV10_07985 [Lachnoanaerobaculum gingivalis]